MRSYSPTKTNSTQPSALNSLINALEERLYPPLLLILRGSEDGLTAIKTIADTRYATRLLCMAIPDNETELPDRLREKKAGNTLTGYVCEGLSCQPPIQNRQQLERLIRENSIETTAAKDSID